MGDLPEFDFDQWLSEAKVAQASVEVLQRPDLLADLQDWQRRYDREVKAVSHERSLTDADSLANLRVEGRHLVEAVQASRVTFYLTNLPDKDLKAIEKAYPMPDPPVTFNKPLPELASNATVEQSQAFLAAWDAWKQERDQFIGEHAAQLSPWQDKMEQALRLRGAERIARSVVSMKQAGVTKKIHLTAEQVVQMEERLGKPQMALFSEALDRLKDETPNMEVPAAFLSRTSATSQY